MTQQNSENKRKPGRISGTGRNQQLILSVFADNPELQIIPQYALHIMARRIASKRFEDGLESEIRLPYRQGIGRALNKLEEQEQILRFKSWHPHPFTTEKKLLSYVVLSDSTLCDVPAREAVGMLEIRNGGSHIPWSVEWLQTQYLGWTFNPALGKGVYMDRREIQKRLALCNEQVIDVLMKDLEPEDEEYEQKVWGRIVQHAIVAGGILKLGEKLFLAGWRQEVMAKVAIPVGENNKGFVLTGTPKELPETSSPRPVVEVLPVEDEKELNGFAKLDRRIEVAQKRIKEMG